MDTVDSFEEAFEALTGNRPLSWQTRLYVDQFANGNFPPVIDIPTGLGKTMVMAIWLIARAARPCIPTRLVYVVDRRTVVDQATDLAEGLAFLLARGDPERFQGIAKRRPELVKRKQEFAGVFESLRQRPGLAGNALAISTLRGQLADNREWSRDPSRPAIIIGTVDLIGSALLFSGYRSGRKRRPLEAGLLGQDSLLVLDEAHLSKPFEKLLGSISGFQKSHGQPMRVICMSATGSLSADSKPFTLQYGNERNLAGEDANDATITTRFGASKTLSLVTSEKPVEAIATEAAKLASEKPGSRIVIFVRTPRQVMGIRKALEKKKKDYTTRIAQLTGTMRGLERDELVDTAKLLGETDHERRVMQRFLKPENDPSHGECFLISTSAGEVGFDLNADHLVCDAAPLDSMIQRLGRVNRRGAGAASVVLVRESQPADKTELDKACLATLELLADGLDVSPRNIATLKETDHWKEKREEACAPQPAMVPLTDILLDAWSMTSITEPMPGRPGVGPWLRGIADEQAQTSVAWRAELDLFAEVPTPENALQMIFTKHPIRPHESATVNTGTLLEFLKQIPRLRDRPVDLTKSRVAVRFPRGQIECRTLQQLIDDPGILYADTTLILPSRFGGLNAGGMLDAEAIPNRRKHDDPEPPSLDVADLNGYEQTAESRSRLRIVIVRSDEGSWKPEALPGLSIPDDITLKPPYAKSSALLNDLKTANLRVRLVQAILRDDEGDPVRSLVLLAPAPKANGNEDQLLTEHVGAVEAEARRIADELRLDESDPFRIALLFAARWHDEGKKAAIWQRFANNPDPNAPPLGKMAQSRDPKSLHRYRHEFGSLLRIQFPDRCKTIGCDLPTDPDARELALHLIASHHGGARPHFEIAVYDPFIGSEFDGAHTEAIRRFARLQRKYGWWKLAWLENLLRCADQLASAADDATEIDELEGAAP